jgi:hypothetical protein
VNKTNWADVRPLEWLPAVVILGGDQIRKWGYDPSRNPFEGSAPRDRIELPTREFSVQPAAIIGIADINSAGLILTLGKSCGIFFLSLY